MKLSDCANKYKQFSRSSIHITIEGKEVYPTEDYSLDEAKIALHLSSNINYVDLLFTQIECETRFTSDYLCGSKILIHIGYQETEKQVFMGYIHTLTWNRKDQLLTSVRVYAQDVRGLMKLSTHYKTVVKNVDLLLSEIMNQTLYTSYVDKVKISGIKDSYQKMRFIQKKDDFSFLCYLANLFHCDFYVANDTLYFTNAYQNKQISMVFDYEAAIDHVNVVNDVQDQMGQFQFVSYGNDYEMISFSSTHTLASLPLSSRMKKITQNTKQYQKVNEMKDTASLQAYGEGESKRIKHQFVKVKITMCMLPDIACGDIIQVDVSEHLKQQKVYLEKVIHRISRVGSISILEGSIIQ